MQQIIRQLLIVIGVIMLLSIITGWAAALSITPTINHLEQMSDNSFNLQTGSAPIGDTNVEKLVKVLNKAYSDEWFAYHQYWIGSKIVRGPNKEAVIAILTLHATEENQHVVLLLTRIIQLGGTPVLEPRDWYRLTYCGYDAPTDPDVIKVLEQNIKSEQCSINMYNNLLVETRDKDPVTYTIVLGIFQMEVEHKEDLQALLDDTIVMTNP